MKRRDFLHPRHVAGAAGQVLGALDALTDLAPAAVPDEVAYLHLSRRAMATTFELILPLDTGDALAVGDAVFDLIDQLEAQMTVYRDTSEISGLNQRAGDGPVAVEERLFELLSLAARIHQETEGAFDPAAGALVKAWGFWKGPPRVPSPAERRQASLVSGMRHVLLDRSQRTVRFRQRGVEFNLGSIGKGYALDRAAELLRRWNFSTALLHGGKSSVYAMGKQPGSQRGWPVVVQHPWQPGVELGTVWLSDQGLATSAATHRHLEWRGRNLGHILDPRRGWPAEILASATAIAPTAAEADALSTAFFILGVEKTVQYCQKHPGIAAVLLPAEPDARPVHVGFASSDAA